MLSIRHVSVGSTIKWAVALGLCIFAARAVADIAGDVNDDGKVDVADLHRVMQLADDPQSGTPSERRAADVAPLVAGEGPRDGDFIDAADVLVLSRALTTHDVDEDGLPPNVEAILGLSPVSRDSDGTGPDDGELDSDGDGLSNRFEVETSGTRADLADSDGDGASDGAEVLVGSNPNGSDPIPSPTLAPLPAVAQNPLTVSGTSTPGAELTLYVNGLPFSPGLADANGAFAVSVTIEPGPNEIFAAARIGSDLSAPSAIAVVSLQGPCAADVECEDGDPCTDDICSAGLCMSPTGTCLSDLPLLEDFESGAFDEGLSAFANRIGDQLDWIRRSGPVPNRDAFVRGPAADHTTGSGFYLYTEYANNPPTAFEETILESACLDLSGAESAELRFFYHQFVPVSLSFGALQVEVARDCSTSFESLATLGSAGDQWMEKRINLTGYVGGLVRIRFFSTAFVVALDDIALRVDVPVEPVLDPVPPPTTAIPVPVLGSAAPGNTIQLFVDGTSATTVVAGPDGRFAAQLALPAGSSTITARATDGVETSPTSGPIVVFVGEQAISSPVLTGPIVAPTVLDSTVSYQVSGTLRVEAQASLRIPAGTRIVFAPAASLDVRGRLIVEGTPGEQIVLTGEGAIWEGIDLRGVGSSNRFAYVRFEDVRDVVQVYPGASLEVEHVTIDFATPQTSGTAIRFFEGAAGRVVDSTFRNLAEAVVFAGPERLEIERNLFENVRRPVYATDGTIIVHENTIRDCVVGLRLLGPVHPSILDNEIRGCTVLGMELAPVFLDGYPAGLPEPVIRGNDIVDNAFSVRIGGQFGSAKIDLTGNYWGSVDADAIAATIVDRGSPNGVNKGGIAVFCPYLDAARDQSPTSTQSPDSICGAISQDLTIAQGSVQRLSGSVIVEPGVTVTMEPESSFTFGPRAGLHVFGELVAESDPETFAPFVFGPLDPAATPGAWKTIEASEAGLLRIRNARIDRANVGATMRHESEIHLLDTSIVRSLSAGIEIGAGAGLIPIETVTGDIARCLIEGESRNQGVGVVIDRASPPRVEDLELTENTVHSLRIAFSISEGAATMRGNTVDDVQLGFDLMGEPPTRPVIEGNIIRANEGIFFSSGTDALVVGNSFLPLDSFDTGIVVLNASPEIIGNDIRGLRIGILISRDSAPVIRGENLISENEVGIRIEGGNDTPSPVIRGNGIFANQRNIELASLSFDGTPLDLTGNFFDVSTFAEIQASVFVESGARVPIDVSGFLAELGGFPVTGSENSIINLLAVLAASPRAIHPRIGETTAISFEIFETGDDVKLEIFELDGTSPIREFAFGDGVQGVATANWDGRDQAGELVRSGGYRYVVSAEIQGVTQRIDPVGPLGPINNIFGINAPFRPRENDFFELFVSTFGSTAYNYRLFIVPAFRFFDGVPAYEACVAANECVELGSARTVAPGPEGADTRLFDGRKADGSFVDFSFGVRPVGNVGRPNYVLVKGIEPQISGTTIDIEVKADPYQITHSYDQFTRIAYRLNQRAVVTVKLLKPGPAGSAPTLVTLVDAATQDPGVDHVVEYRGWGTGPGQTNNILTTDEGVHTFTIEARDPDRPELSTTYRGLLELHR